MCDPVRNLWAKDGFPSYETIEVGCTVWNKCELDVSLSSVFLDEQNYVEALQTTLRARLRSARLRLSRVSQAERKIPKLTEEKIVFLDEE